MVISLMLALVIAWVRFKGGIGVITQSIKKLSEAESEASIWILSLAIKLRKECYDWLLASDSDSTSDVSIFTCHKRRRWNRVKKKIKQFRFFKLWFCLASWLWFQLCFLVFTLTKDGYDSNYVSISNVSENQSDFNHLFKNKKFRSSRVFFSFFFWFHFISFRISICFDPNMYLSLASLLGTCRLTSRPGKWENEYRRERGE